MWVLDLCMQGERIQEITYILFDAKEMHDDVCNVFGMHHVVCNMCSCQHGSGTLFQKQREQILKKISAKFLACGQFKLYAPDFLMLTRDHEWQAPRFKY